MLRKKIRISRWFLAAVLIYAVFVSILFVRMKIAERMLAEYYEARSCPSTSNCREMVSATVLESGSKHISFINYGSRGLPIQRGTFEEYQFKLSLGGAETNVVKVLPGAPSDSSRFDVANIYIPAKSDRTVTNTQVLEGTSVVVEVWRDRITLMTIALPAIEQANGPAPGALSIGPPGKTQEITLATTDHPVIVAESSRNDFSGWAGGPLFLVVPALILGSIVIGFFHGVDWLIQKINSSKRKKTE